ncbi:hypothetical protein QBC41DRAFT_144076 [Cercophora samala]|uniref:Uncharacterized protein n=1 Tax=Cercophora samala TaxID=330535 RepID=A0AA39ZLM9_9PEZI|nr:hypothetical protein QBC41DRAFT_144076 [Cercophora samala]
MTMLTSAVTTEQSEKGRLGWKARLPPHSAEHLNDPPKTAEFANGTSFIHDTSTLEGAVSITNGTTQSNIANSSIHNRNGTSTQQPELKITETAPKARSAPIEQATKVMNPILPNHPTAPGTSETTPVASRAMPQSNQAPTSASSAPPDQIPGLGRRPIFIYHKMKVQSPKKSSAPTEIWPEEEYDKRFHTLSCAMNNAINKNPELRDGLKWIEYSYRMAGPSLETAKPCIIDRVLSQGGLRPSRKALPQGAYLPATEGWKANN